MSHPPRRTRLGVVLAAAILSLTACSQGSATRAGADDATSSGTTTVTYMNFSANGGHEKDLQAIADAFHKENPDIVVKIETVPMTRTSPSYKPQSQVALPVTHSSLTTKTSSLMRPTAPWLSSRTLTLGITVHR